MVPWLAVVLNVVAVVIYVFIGGFVVPSIVNAVIMIAYLYYSRAVRFEALR